MQRRSFWGVSTLFIIGTCTARACPPGWAVVDLGPVTLSSPGSAARLSNSGYAVGEQFLWHCGAPAQGIAGEAGGVNDAGHACGWTNAFGGGPYGYFWDGTQLTPIGTFLPDNGGSSYAFGLNNSNVVVGETNGDAFIWVDGKMSALPENGPVSYAFDISDTGYIAGLSGGVACRWHDGAITVIGMLPGDTGGSYGFGVNDAGDVVGYSSHSGSQKAFLFSPPSLAELPPLPGNDYNVAFSINNAGQAVGVATDGGPFPYYAVLWENGTVIDLQTRVYAPLGMNLETAYDINDSGWIIGQSVIAGGYHAYLMRPASAADVNCDGSADITDVLLVINGWGPCAGSCAADLNSNGIVNIDDLLAVINGWGTCP